MSKTRPASQKRNLRPHPSIHVAPLSLSQLTCEPTIGINAPRYLEACRIHAPILKPARVGKLVVTTLDAWERLIAHLGAIGGDLPEEPLPTNDTAIPDDVDGVLARLGLKRRAS